VGPGLFLGRGCSQVPAMMFLPRAFSFAAKLTPLSAPFRILF
jgi:hypothetical protein